MKIGIWIGGVLLALVLAYLGVATWFYLQKTDAPFAAYPMSEADWRTLQEQSGVSFTQDAPFVTRSYAARDGVQLAARVFGEPSDTVVVYLHGVNSDASRLNTSAGLLHEAAGAQVITPDFRGHGQSGGAPFRVDHIGQYEEDVADIVREVRADAPDARLVLAGHSMGGGVALRYAVLDDAPDVDAYLLFSPNFGEGPTQRAAPEGAGTDADPARGWVYFDSKAFGGVLMYYILGVTLANDTPVLYFNNPGRPADYSFAAVLSAQPIRPDTADKALQAVGAPLFVMVGENDEVFDASAYPAFVSANSGGQAVVAPGHNHNSLMNDAEAMQTAATWLQSL